MTSFLIYSAVGFSVPIIVALILIASQRPVADLRGDGLDFSGQKTTEPPATLVVYQASDGANLAFRRYDCGQQGRPLLVCVHGSGWHGLQFDRLAKKIAAQGLADVLVPDLRGHGVAPQPRGDVKYVGQFEDDLAGLIAENQQEGQKIVMLGHSSGGGLVVRFAGGKYGKTLDLAVLLAPYIHHRAATMRKNSGGWAHVLTRRIIGISILNTFRIKLLNRLTVIQFLFPDQILNGPLGNTVTRSYSFRLNKSFAPRNAYQRDIAALPPFLLIAGARDEAFRAEAYQPMMSAITQNGQYAILPDVSHLEVVDTSQTIALITEFLKSGGADRRDTK
ncbi:MAG: alpha/beta fold hydrolase [Rhodobacteraceae bacterium]|nr:alpha/beta fold hydrolase [Paracoccaceae bacterium]